MNTKTISYDIQILIARIFIVGLFAMSAFGKITAFSAQAGFAGSSWITATLPFLSGEVLLIAAILMEVIGVLLVLTGWNMKYGAYILIVYTFLTSIMFHIGDEQLIAFLKNLSVIGGLLVLSMISSGKFSLSKNKN
ncbi:MAG: DoxX family protein [Nanoarchaeota archaeon]|nr:DoxX family protein [Nanoarchaeota archaeon]